MFSCEQSVGSTTTALLTAFATPERWLLSSRVFRSLIFEIRRSRIHCVLVCVRQKKSMNLIKKKRNISHSSQHDDKWKWLMNDRNEAYDFLWTWSEKGEKKVGRLFSRLKWNRVDAFETERIVFDCKICKLMNRINFRDKHDNKRKSSARVKTSACLSVPRQDGEWFVRVFAQMLLYYSTNGYCIEECLGNSE